MTTLETALTWLDLGIAVIPIAYRSKFPYADALRWVGSINANGTARWTNYQDRLPTRAEIETWCRGPRINLAVVTGWQDLVVLDFDQIDTYITWSAWAQESETAAEVAELTYQVTTDRGMHVYVGVTEPVRNGHIGVIDIKAAGGYVLIPPSIHPSGSAYRAVDPAAPIVRVERLLDVFPFELAAPPPVRSVLPTFELAADPWTAAERPVIADTDTGLVSRILSGLRIEDLIPTPQHNGQRWLLTHCPLHDDQQPSFWIDTQQQISGCYAGCTTKPLDAIGLYARMHHLSNTEAIRVLANKV